MTLISESAGFDIIEAIAFYSKIDTRIGIRLRDSIKSTINNIELNPLMFPTVYKEYKRALTRNFAYSVYYLVESNGDIIIKAVLSQKISYKLIKQRLA